jgi:hypothetical protein
MCSRELNVSITQTHPVSREFGVRLTSLTL